MKSKTESIFLSICKGEKKKKKKGKNRNIVLSFIGVYSTIKSKLKVYILGNFKD